MQNALYYGDNLKILREQIADETVDLIYLDPPFNSSRTYNLLFKQHKGGITVPPRSWRSRTRGRGTLSCVRSSRRTGGTPSCSTS
jgi:16S rRNA G966 N2-methylase RsmD